MHVPNQTQPRLSPRSTTLRLIRRPTVLAVFSMGPLLTSLPAAMAQSAPTSQQHSPAAVTIDPFAAEAPAQPARPADTGVAWAQAALTAARQHVGDLQSRVDRDQADLAALNQRLTQEDATAARQRDDLAKVEQALTAKRQAADSAKAMVESAKADYDAAWKGAISTFESSDAIGKAKAAADAARAAAVGREEADLKQLAATDAFKRAQDAASTTEQALQTLAATRPSNDSDVADATQTAGEAKARLTELQSRYLGEDAQLQSARAKAQEAAVALDALRQRFDKQLPQLPAIASAQSNLESRQATVDAATPDLKQAEAARDTAGAAARKTADAMAPDCETVSRLEKELNDLNGQLAQARADTDRAHNSFNSALAAADQARQQQAAVAEQTREHAAAEQARQQAALAAEQQARQQASLAASQAPSTAVPQTPFDNLPPAQAPQQQGVASGQLPPAQVAPGQVPAGQYGNVPPGQYPNVPPSQYGNVPQGQYVNPPAYTYPVVPPATGYTNSYPPAVVYEPAAVSQPVYVDSYAYPYTYAYAPYEVSVGGYFGGRYYTRYGNYTPYREREVVVRGGGGYDGYSGSRYYSNHSYSASGFVGIRREPFHFSSSSRFRAEPRYETHAYVSHDRGSARHGR
jgi:hypothetical protein